jgi:hypothetical protein
VSSNPFEEPRADLEVRSPASADAESIRQQYLRTETNLKSIATVYIVFGSMGTLVLLVLVLAAIWTLVTPNSLLLGIMEWLIVMSLGAVYPVGLLAGLALRRFRRWGRYTAVALACLGLLGFPIGTIVSVLFLYLLLNQKANFVFSDEYQAIIRQTPHLESRTSWVAWAAIATVFLWWIAVGVVVDFAYGSSGRNM